MSHQPRLRVFAGPNGSGKSTLLDDFSKNYPTGHVLNADLFEDQLSQKGYIDLADFNLNLTQHDLNTFLATHQAQSLLNRAQMDKYFIDIAIAENIIVDRSKSTHSYEGALISSFLRDQLMKVRQDFSFETVMSYKPKIDELRDAGKMGYKVYLYFICIDDPSVNISRVENRVQKGGHNVDSSKIVSRYGSTLNNLMAAIEVCNKCYLFDNSDEKYRWIANICENKKLELLIEPEDLPNWFSDYVLPHYKA